MAIDVLDLTALQKRGLLKSTPRQTEDVLDLTIQRPPQPSAVTSSESSSAFDFLSSFAQASATPTVPSAPTSSYHEELTLKLDTIVNKLDDAMYKIEMMSTRIAQLESKLKI